MPDGSAFSPDYVSARARFRSSALALGCHMESHAVDPIGPDGEELTIDIAVLGSRDPTHVVLVSSGLHGVEGYLGSAIQASLLEEAIGAWRPPPDSALILIHGLNPWGMAWKRRVNEDNVDLNRNFLLPGQSFKGAPASYAVLDSLLNPRSPPSRLDPFLPQAILAIARHGRDALASSATGQYDRPRSLFFGGNTASRTADFMRQRMPHLLGRATRVLHLDFHTGVGRRACPLLLSRHPEGSRAFADLSATFGESLVSDAGTKAQGDMRSWMQVMLDKVDYDGISVEFGTVGPLRILEALREENRAWHYGDPEHPRTRAARDLLYSVFCPIDQRWRDRVVPEGVRLVHKALERELDAARSATCEV
ncbi:MAG: putative deacylase [Kiritimatiellia bacterium]|jgi:predicted deacylase